WALAEALELRDQGEKQPAYVKLETALKWLPDSPVLLLHRAAWRLDDGQEQEALADAQRAAELGSDRVDVLIPHSQLMAYCGRAAEAVADWKKIDGISQR